MWPDDRLMQILQALAVLLFVSVGAFVVGPRQICLGQMGEIGLDRDLFRGGDVRPDPGFALGADSDFLRKDSPVGGCATW